MNLTISQSALFAELKLLQGIANTKGTIPILANVLIEATSDGVILSATDLDANLIIKVGATVTTPGAIAVNNKKLFEIVKSVEGEISLKVVDERLEIRAGNSRFKIATQLREHFPSLPTMGPVTVSILSGILQSAVSRVKYAITQEESRFALSGALMILEPNRLSLVATDGHRLAVSRDTIEYSGDTVRVLVPKKALGELEKLAAGEGSVEIAKDDNHVFFKLGDRTLGTRLLDGQFPNYELVIPKETPIEVSLKPDQFQRSLARAAIMSDEKSHAVLLEFTPGNLTLLAQTAELGDAKESIDIEYQGEPVTIRLNASYVQDYLSAHVSGNVILSLKDDKTPLRIGPGGDGFFNVIMPMRI